MTKRRTLTIVGIVAALAAIGAGWAFSQQSTHPTIDTAQAATQTLSASFTSPGRLTAPTATSVSARTTGILASLAVTDGQQVEAGQLLGTLDAAPLDLAVTRAEAEVGAARAMPTGSDRLNYARTAAITAAEAARQQARDDRAHAEITAPVAGTVQFASLTLAPGTQPVYQTHAGASVSPSLPLFTIVDLTALRFEAQVDEADVARVDVGQTAQVQLDAFPAEEFLGKVSALRPTAVTTSTGGVAFPVDVTLDPTDKRLLVGMTGDAHVETATVENATVIPARAVLSDGGQSYVWVVRDGVVHRRQVHILQANDLEVQVAELTPGETVAVGTITSLTEGAKVDVRS